jgi:arsenite/tail-anchored protein-transporting ATPase
VIEQLLKRRLIFCGGKGGVGKTTLSAALAVRAARQGRRTRLISTDPAHSLSDLLEQPLGPEPTRTHWGFDACELDPEQLADQYLARTSQNLRDYVRPRLYDEIDRQMGQARGAPGTLDAAFLEHLAGLIRRDDESDLLIFDTAPTGHTLHLLSLPETMAAWTDGLLGRFEESQKMSDRLRGVLPGRDESASDQRRARLAQVLNERKRLFRLARERLTNADHTAFVLVMIPERLSVLETARAMDTLTDYGIPVGGLIINQILPASSSDEFLSARRGVQEAHLEEIARRFAGQPMLEVPLWPQEILSSQGLEGLADQLATRSAKHSS